MVSAVLPADPQDTAPGSGVGEIGDRIGQTATSRLRKPQHMGIDGFVQRLAAPLRHGEAFGRVDLALARVDLTMWRRPAAVKSDPVGVGHLAVDARDGSPDELALRDKEKFAVLPTV